MKKMLCFALAALLCCAAWPGAARAEGAGAPQTPQAPIESAVSLNLNAVSATLIEAETGRAIFAHNAAQRRPVASITKIMTILLTLEAIEAQEVSLDDQVLCSKRAAGMGGSQALLDGDQYYRLEELLKATIVASANDAAVALAEHIAGAEELFVQRMNRRAAELGLADTRYLNCTGLPAEGHYTTAADIAQLSRRLDAHPLYYKYSTIWMDTVTHKGGRVTDLTNTNRLVRFYENCDGYKTGSTNEAGYCVSATAKRGNLRLIAVVLGSTGSQARFDAARAMLDYGFTNYQLAQVANARDRLGMAVAVRRGAQESVQAVVGQSLALLLKKGEEKGLRMEAALPERVDAPVRAGDLLGEVRVMLGDSEVARLPAVAGEDVPLPGFLEGLLRILTGWRL
ncbi:MAG: D-alanyl-D-alanine carboxypeptidase [Oscillospiraceae bacterium]|jgi:D-alanyl-D-alanine carboxypeptidase (penicillin-binding protein 5/6)|nr:D-alanyl-D-alanine carboxypeptidase [Oscillospiraceae bacterium]